MARSGEGYRGAEPHQGSWRSDPRRVIEALNHQGGCWTELGRVTEASNHQGGWRPDLGRVTEAPNHQGGWWSDLGVSKHRTTRVKRALSTETGNHQGVVASTNGSDAPNHQWHLMYSTEEPNHQVISVHVMFFRFMFLRNRKYRETIWFRES